MNGFSKIFEDSDKLEIKDPDPDLFFSNLLVRHISSSKKNLFLEY